MVHRPGKPYVVFLSNSVFDVIYRMTGTRYKTSFVHPWVNKPSSWQSPSSDIRAVLFFFRLSSTYNLYEHNMS
jgi:hypothetical protein